jgi:hypothetical protein
VNLGSVRSLVLGLNQAAHGVTATVTRTGHAAVETTAIWQTTPAEETQPFGHDLTARGPRRVMVLTKEDFPDGVERGTPIVAPEVDGGANLTWQVDAQDRAEADHWRVLVVRT